MNGHHDDPRRPDPKAAPAERDEVTPEMGAAVEPDLIDPTSDDLQDTNELDDTEDRDGDDS